MVLLSRLIHSERSTRRGACAVSHGLKQALRSSPHVRELAMKQVSILLTDHTHWVQGSSLPLPPIHSQNDSVWPACAPLTDIYVIVFFERDLGALFLSYLIFVKKFTNPGKIPMPRPVFRPVAGQTPAVCQSQLPATPRGHQTSPGPFFLHRVVCQVWHQAPGFPARVPSPCSGRRGQGTRNTEHETPGMRIPENPAQGLLGVVNLLMCRH